MFTNGNQRLKRRHIIVFYNLKMIFLNFRNQTMWKSFTEVQSRGETKKSARCASEKKWPNEFFHSTSYLFFDWFVNLKNLNFRAKKWAGCELATSSSATGRGTWPSSWRTSRWRGPSGFGVTSTSAASWSDWSTNLVRTSFKTGSKQVFQMPCGTLICPLTILGALHLNMDNFCEVMDVKQYLSMI